MATTVTFEQLNLGTEELAAMFRAGGLSERAAVEIAAAIADLIATTLRHEEKLKALRQELAKYKQQRKKKRT